MRAAIAIFFLTHHIFPQGGWDLSHEGMISVCHADKDKYYHWCRTFYHCHHAGHNRIESEVQSLARPQSGKCAVGHQPTSFPAACIPYQCVQTSYPVHVVSHFQMVFTLVLQFVSAKFGFSIVSRYVFDLRHNRRCNVPTMVVDGHHTRAEPWVSWLKERCCDTRMFSVWHMLTTFSLNFVAQDQCGRHARNFSKGCCDSAKTLKGTGCDLYVLLIILAHIPGQCSCTLHSAPLPMSSWHFCLSPSRARHKRTLYIEHSCCVLFLHCFFNYFSIFLICFKIIGAMFWHVLLFTKCFHCYHSLLNILDMFLGIGPNLLLRDCWTKLYMGDTLLWHDWNFVLRRFFKTNQFCASIFQLLNTSQIQSNNAKTSTTRKKQYKKQPNSTWKNTTHTNNNMQTYKNPEKNKNKKRPKHVTTHQQLKKTPNMTKTKSKTYRNIMNTCQEQQRYTEKTHGNA